ncbi:hypothetical protein EXIGLDRAFT_731165 [Exidia glandulosa HHB12029]|uniref:Uncharacterized protein n=1 Tax=Exidia glandulosa HHB12029 TaxID=1314781 RepID=A0A165BZ64_EXIGL|nr:hypothetical protein EXIGLDRAFT_731165 [Exidia glandulosa HHB12029]
MARLALSTLIARDDVLLAVAREHALVYDKFTGSLLRTTKLESRIRACALDPSARNLVVVDDSKKLQVLAFDTLTVQSSRSIAKKSDIALVTPNGEQILLADKFGDVFAYPLHPPADTPTTPATEPILGELIFGHVSTLTTFLLAPPAPADPKFIISADRDEHIRISHYPLGYVIHTFCLGSTKYVTALHIPPSAPELLLSGGGEDELRLWRWHEGKLLKTIPVGEVVRPRVTVRPPVLKTKPPAAKRQKTDEVEEEKVLAVSRIESIGNVVLFSLLGANALFYFQMDWSALDAPVSVRALEFDSPVVDFVLDGEKIWVSLDAQPPSAPLASATWDASTSALVMAPAPALSFMPEGDADTDLYLPLALLPKHPDDEGWDAVEAGEAMSDKQRGRRKVKEQLKALQQPASPASVS